MALALEKTVYTAQATSTGGRDGKSRSSDGAIDLKLEVPKEMGGAGKPGTNPEQLFAAGYSACFLGAMKFVAGAQKIALPNDTAITADVGIGPLKDKAGFGVTVAMAVSIPGMARAQAEALVAAAHEVCPYSNATRGNVDVKLTVA